MSKQSAHTHYEFYLKQLEGYQSAQAELNQVVKDQLLPAVKEAYAAAKDSNVEQVRVLAAVLQETLYAIQQPAAKNTLKNYSQVMDEVAGKMPKRKILMSAMSIFAGVILLVNAAAIGFIAIKFFPPLVALGVLSAALGVGLITHHVNNIKKHRQHAKLGKCPVAVLTACGLFKQTNWPKPAVSGWRAKFGRRG